jgi:hypothetical protein
VDDILGMRGGEHIEQLLCNRQNTFQVQAVGSRLPHAFQCHAMEQLHDEKGRAVIGNVVVQDSDRTVMLDAVGDVALAHEALTNEGVERELPMQHLERKALAVAMLDRIDHGHAAIADHGLDDVFVVDGPPQPSRDKLAVLRNFRHVHWGRQQGTRKTKGVKKAGPLARLQNRQKPTKQGSSQAKSSR